MKKTLAAVAILGAFAGSAMADVTVYGRLDTGLKFSQDTWTSSAFAYDVEERSWGLNSGSKSTSRLGVKGTEKIGDMTVGFVLETKVLADTGSAFAADKSEAGFNREAQLFVKGAYGTLAAGRMGTIASDAGSYGFAAAAMSPFGSGATNALGTGLFASPKSRWDNMVVYQTPVMAGAQVSVQYGMGDKDENTSKADRYAAVGVNYKAGALQLVGTVESVNEESAVAGKQDDALVVNFGGNYDFGVAKVYAGAQYFKDVDDAAGALGALNSSPAKFVPGATATAFACDTIDGFGLTAGFDAPVFGGKVAFGASYVEADGLVDGYNDTEMEGWNVGASYQYNLSKQTYVYAIGGYTHIEATSKGVANVPAGKGEKDTVAAAVGIVHSF